ncbi:MAG TPA: hypothetical protein VFV18_05025 [Porticoccaceae bacterium]|nr:hypothetical protein [Porticoccaceae bacterium]
MKIKRSIRGLSFFALFGCLLALTPAGHAQQFTVSPEMPEAYQPFVVTLIVLCGGQDSNPASVAVDMSAGAIVMVAAQKDFTCPPDQKIANLAGLPGGTYSIERKDAPNGGVDQVYGSLTVAPAPPTQPVFAFYNGDIGHYFITAGTAEKDSLLGGGGGGWAIVDAGFNAWPAAGPAPAAAKPVCRFYSAAVNSHFYTAGPNECELLKQPGSGWIYEGIAFRALVPTKGSCYPGTTPVWRLYNDRFAQSDSNHRFVTSVDTYRHMIAKGWIGEGVAFCSPPA